MLAYERSRLEKARFFQDAKLKHKRLEFLLGRLEQYNLQSTLVTGFAFNAFGADALHDLPYDDHPIRSVCFACSAAVAMAAAVVAVFLSSFLSNKAERLAMNTSVDTAVFAVRARMPTIAAFFSVSLVGLFGASTSLLFAMCHDLDDGRSDALCNSTGFVVLAIFFGFSAIALAVLLAMRREFSAYDDAHANAPFFGLGSSKFRRQSSMVDDRRSAMGDDGRSVMGDDGGDGVDWNACGGGGAHCSLTEALLHSQHSV